MASRMCGYIGRGLVSAIGTGLVCAMTRFGSRSAVASRMCGFIGRGLVSAMTRVSSMAGI